MPASFSQGMLRLPHAGAEWKRVQEQQRAEGARSAGQVPDVRGCDSRYRNREQEGMRHCAAAEARHACAKIQAVQAWRRSAIGLFLLPWRAATLLHAGRTFGRGRHEPLRAHVNRPGPIHLVAVRHHIREQCRARDLALPLLHHFRGVLIRERSECFVAERKRIGERLLELRLGLQFRLQIVALVRIRLPKRGGARPELRVRHMPEQLTERAELCCCAGLNP